MNKSGYGVETKCRTFLRSPQLESGRTGRHTGRLSGDHRVCMGQPEDVYVYHLQAVHEGKEHRDHENVPGHRPVTSVQRCAMRPSVAIPSDWWLAFAKLRRATRLSGK